MKQHFILLETFLLLSRRYIIFSTTFLSDAGGHKLIWNGLTQDYTLQEENVRQI